MNKDYLGLKLDVRDVDLLRECVKEKLKYWQGALTDCKEGDAAAGEFGDGCSEQSMEYYKSRLESILNHVEELMQKVEVNRFEVVDEFFMFRPTQRAEVVRVFGAKADRIIFIFHTRHGSCLVYDELEGFVRYFIDDSETDWRFQSEAELDAFLKFCL